MDKVILGIVIVLVLIIGMSVLMAVPLMLAWNYVMPYLFDLKTINFWQSFALLIVAGSLIKSSNATKK
jgi:hypothetical protein